MQTVATVSNGPTTDAATLVFHSSQMARSAMDH